MKRKISTNLLIISLLFLFVATVGAEECSINPKEYVLKVRGAGEYSVEPDSFSVKFIVESERRILDAVCSSFKNNKLQK